MEMLSTRGKQRWSDEIENEKGQSLFLALIWGLFVSPFSGKVCTPFCQERAYLYLNSAWALEFLDNTCLHGKLLVCTCHRPVEKAFRR